MGGIIIWKGTVPAPGHYLFGDELLLDLIKEFLEQHCFMSDIAINYDRGFDSQFYGRVLEAFGFKQKATPD